MENIFQILSTVPDHRRGNHLIYPIDYLLLISFSGIMSGFTTWSDFELYAQLHEEDLKMLYKRGPLHNKQALLFIHFMCVRRPFSTRQLPPATYRFPLKGQYEVLNPSYSEETCSNEAANQFNASALGQPVQPHRVLQLLFYLCSPVSMNESE